MTALQIKQWIYENKKIDFVLQNLGCRHIIYHINKGYWSCTNADEGADNPGAVCISDTQWLDYTNWTRGVQPSDKQDIINFVQYVKNIDFVAALRYLHDIFHIPYTYYHKEPIIKKKDPLMVFKRYLSRNRYDVANVKPVSEDILRDFVPIEYISWLHEGITPAACKRFGIMYDYDHKRIVIPHKYALTGELLGYNARTTVEHYEAFGLSKYWITPGLVKSSNLYGYWENYKYINQKGYVVVFESEKSVLKLASFKENTAVALSGKTISEEQIRLLAGLKVNEIIIALDKDVSLDEIKAICSRLHNIRKVSYIYDKTDLLTEPKDSPCDEGYKKYYKLFNNRINYKG